MAAWASSSSPPVCTVQSRANHNAGGRIFYCVLWESVTPYRRSEELLHVSGSPSSCEEDIVIHSVCDPREAHSVYNV